MGVTVHVPNNGWLRAVLDGTIAHVAIITRINQVALWEWCYIAGAPPVTLERFDLVSSRIQLELFTNSPVFTLVTNSVELTIRL